MGVFECVFYKTRFTIKNKLQYKHRCSSAKLNEGPESNSIIA